MRSFVLALALLLLPSLALGDCGLSHPMSEQTRNRLQKAYSYMQGNHPESAERILSGYMAGTSHPHPYGILLYGSLLLNTNQLEKAADILGKGCREHPDCRPIVHNLAVVRYEQEKFLQAGELFLKSCELAKKPARCVRYQAAVCFYQSERYARAYAVAAPLLEHARVRPDWVRLSAHCLIQLKRWPEAERTLLRFLKRSPDNHGYWKLLANVRMARKHYKQAASALEIAYRLKAPNQTERRTLSQLYLYVNAPLLATHALEDDFADSPSPEVCDHLARAYAAAGRVDQAIAVLDQAIARENSAERWLTKGKLLYGRRHYGKAAKALRQAVKLKEETGLAHFLLGMTYWERKDWNQARQWFARAEGFKRHAKRAARAIRAIDAMEATRRQSEEPLGEI